MAKEIPAKIIRGCYSCEYMRENYAINKYVGVNEMIDKQYLNLRESVIWFSQQMELTLRKHDDRKGWML
jgi:hypothetical protein